MFKVQGLICLFFLSTLDLSLETLGWAHCHTLRETSALVRVCSDIALASLIRHLCRGARGVSGEDFVCAFRLFELLRLDVSDQDRSFLFLALSVIEFEGCFILGVRD